MIGAARGARVALGQGRVGACGIDTAKQPLRLTNSTSPAQVAGADGVFAEKVSGPGLAAMRFTSTASSNECSPCCCGSRSCAAQPSPIDPFRKNGRRGRCLLG
jgi:hypothetical protein